MSNGLTSDGFQRKRLNDILADVNANFKSAFGENLNIAPQSPDGQIIGLLSGSFSDLWEIAEGAYNNFNPNFATGDALSNLVLLNFIERRKATATTVELEISGTSGTIIPKGSLVSAQDGSVSFSTDSEVVIGVGGIVNVGATATSTGPLEAVAGTISNIDTIVTGWDSVTNPQDGVIGTNRETDVELRSRRSRSVARPSNTQEGSILSEVLAVNGVEEAFVYSNESDTVDPITGTPPKEFQVVVLGGDDNEIAEAIAFKKPLCVPSFGTITIPVTDSQGFSLDINFTRPSQIDIYVAVELTKFSSYPSDGDNSIKQNIVDYSKGDLIDLKGFGVNDNVINSELYTPVNLVSGHSISRILIGTSPNPSSEDNLTIGFDEISNFNLTNISIVEV